jgi:hypothetical protein
MEVKAESEHVFVAEEEKLQKVINVEAVSKDVIIAEKNFPIIKISYFKIG